MNLLINSNSIYVSFTSFGLIYIALFLLSIAICFRFIEDYFCNLNKWFRAKYPSDKYEVDICYFNWFKLRFELRYRKFHEPFDFPFLPVLTKRVLIKEDFNDNRKRK